ncbi:MAG: GNAT family N-acetyltransferase [Pseudomonadales bacterium]|nr:GNAT family N-acetyltransferase [Pseudomonadales bacterium]
MKRAFREFVEEKDIKAVKQIWLECGWIKDIETDGIYVKDYFQASEDALVALINDEAECAVKSTKGIMQYLDERFDMAAITGVTTSRISRKLGFARELTAELVARQANAGYPLSSLGMFEQGFYDQLGFGTGCYEHWIKFDPATLTVPNPTRPPVRLGIKDSQAMHTAMCARTANHGSVNLLSPLFYETEMKMTENGFGLGFFEEGKLSHFIWGKSEGENGPLVVTFIAYKNKTQFLELLSLLKAQADQINQVCILEPGHIQLQDLLKQPFRSRGMTAKGQFSHESRAAAYWQIRILDLYACLAKTHLNGPSLNFNLTLSDPIESSLPEDSLWRGIAGDYAITLGTMSSAEPVHQTDLPTLKASVNEFTRMWLGVRSASELAISTSLSAEPGLLKRLDETLRLPKPFLGWDY